MSAPVLNKNLFFKRLNRLYDYWKSAGGDDPMSNVDALVLAVGASDDTSYSKSSTMQVRINSSIAVLYS